MEFDKLLLGRAVVGMSFLLAILHVERATANWMLLGVASVGLAPSQPDWCRHLAGLDANQAALCERHPEAMPSVRLGARLGIHECQVQFRHERWNCTLHTTANHSTFDSLIGTGTREMAFIYASSSAGVVHAVTAACSAGNMTSCSCRNSPGVSDVTSGASRWTWGGCSDDVDYGLWFAAMFVDPLEKVPDSRPRDARPLTNLHNNEVGRRAISKHMRLKCRCHGVSGSCAVKTCWRTMSSFRKIGNFLKRKYEKSVEVAPRTRRLLRRRDRRRRRKSIGVLDLVHARQSPNYCRRNDRLGVFGTKGRACRRRSKRADRCEFLCCGRGYNTRVIRRSERCRCKFIWCCSVVCDTCRVTIEKHSCK